MLVPPKLLFCKLVLLKFAAGVFGVRCSFVVRSLFVRTFVVALLRRTKGWRQVCLFDGVLLWSLCSIL